MQLAKIFNEDSIFPERNIEYCRLNLNHLKKKEVDIIIEQKGNLNTAIELKMPMNGMVPEQMFKFVGDIKFLEELKASPSFWQMLFPWGLIPRPSGLKLIHEFPPFPKNHDILSECLRALCPEGKVSIWRNIGAGTKVIHVCDREGDMAD